MSGTLEVHHFAVAGFHQRVGFNAEHVVPGAGGGPHLVVLQQVGVDDDAQVGRVSALRHTSDGG